MLVLMVVCVVVLILASGILGNFIGSKDQASAIDAIALIAVIICGSSLIAGLFVYEHVVGQPIKTSRLELNKKYLVVSRPDNVIWVQKEHSSVVRAFRFDNNLPPDVFIAVSFNGKKVFLNPPTTNLVSPPGQKDDSPPDYTE